MMEKRLLLLGVVLACALTPARAWAQADWEALARDTHRFRQMFDNLGCLPITTEEELIGKESETVLVILGEVPEFKQMSFGEYVDGGGSLLIATDRSLVRNELREFGVGIYGVGARNPGVRVPPEQGYHGLTDCPFVVPTRAQPQLFFFGNEPLDKVAANRSGYLRQDKPLLRVIARFPRQATYPGHLPDDNLPFAAAGYSKGGGRVLIMADHSVFINAMLLQSDNQNAMFALGCVDWLTENGKRKRVFMLNEGHRQTRFNSPLKLGSDATLPPPEVLVSVFDQVMAGLEAENRFNEMAHAPMGSFSKERAISVMILAATMLMIGLVFQRLNAARQRREAGIVPVATSVRELEPGRPIHNLRQTAMMAQGNYWEAAHELAIDVFEPLLASTRPGSKLRINSGRSFLERRKKRLQARAVWQLALDPKPQKWTRRQWLALHALIGPLRQDIAQGKIFLTMPG